MRLILVMNIVGLASCGNGRSSPTDKTEPVEIYRSAIKNVNRIRTDSDARTKSLYSLPRP